jgi:hypothetical protein
MKVFKVFFCFCHVFSKACRYVTIDEKVCKT